MGMPATCSITNAFLLTKDTYLSDGKLHYAGDLNWDSGLVKDVEIVMALGAAAMLLIGILVLTGTFSFPNPYAIFIGIAGAMFSGFIGLPLLCFGWTVDLGLPAFLRVFLIGTLTVLMFWAILDWYKAGSEF